MQPVPDLESLYPITRGWIEKKGRINPAYKSRFFELIGPCLSYREVEDGKIYGEINLDTVVLISPIDNGEENRAGLRFTLKLLDEQNRREWILGFKRRGNILGWVSYIATAMQKYCSHDYEVLELLRPGERPKPKVEVKVNTKNEALRERQKEGLKMYFK